MAGISNPVRQCLLADDVAPLDRDVICRERPAPIHKSFIYERPSDALQEMAPMDDTFRKPSVFSVDPDALKGKQGLDETQMRMLDIPFRWE